MPGLVGFTRSSSPERDADILVRMRSTMCHEQFYTVDPAFEDENICGSRIHIGIVNLEPQPAFASGVFGWVEGEIHNLDELAARTGIAATTTAAFLAQLCAKNQLAEVLPFANGIFAAVLYDPGRGVVQACTDRFGFRHLYWWSDGRQFAWASEVKGFLALPWFVPKIDGVAVRQFLQLGYLLENRTWFDHVALVSSGSVLTWNLRSKTAEERRYWWYDSIPPSTSSLNSESASHELAVRFQRSIARRVTPFARVGLTLSGGLDSRAILAATARHCPELSAVTFGAPGSLDVQIAARAAAVAGAHHHTFEINERNWLRGREQGVWITDGQFNFMHLHAVVARVPLRTLFDVNMNGFAGDIVLGGSYLKKAEYRDVSPTRRIAADIMRCDDDVLPDMSHYRSLKKIDFFFLNNRVRRFVCEGSKLLLSATEQRKPFFDFDLFDFAYSIPDDLRFQSRIYRKMLMHSYPRYFQNIPWQKTGMRISTPRWVERPALAARYNFQRFFGVLGRHRTRDYANYAHWIRTGAGRDFFEAIIDNPKSEYTNYVAQDDATRIFARHLRGEDHKDRLGALVSFELWLRQVDSYRRQAGLTPLDHSGGSSR